MAVLVVRHAKAGDRDRWEGDDALRPLTAEGTAQAEGLAATLAPFAIGRVLSSPYLRCTQTVAPLAAARGLDVEEIEDLAEGAGPAARRLLASLPGGADVTPGDTVLCTHGDVLFEILDGLTEEGGPALPWDAPMKKSSTWVLETEGGRVLAARYLPPPS
jgi:broad specificity phosphatase PhoE